MSRLDDLKENNVDDRSHPSTDVLLPHSNWSDEVDSQSLIKQYIYLNQPSTHIENLEKINSEQLHSEPMADTCRAAVVIPAHNEAQNIESTLCSLALQEFAPDSGISPDNFEVVVVVNNTSDDTAERVRNFISKNSSLLRFHIIDVTFDERERGVGSARKIGSDLALMRAAARTLNPNEFYLIGLDADNPNIPANHLQRVIETFRNTHADTLAGGTRILLESFPPSSGLPAASDCIRRTIIPKLGLEVNNGTSGANHAISRKMYIEIGGYPQKKTGEDIFMGDETRRLGGKVVQLESDIGINPRRIALDPMAYLKGTAYLEDQFDNDNDAVRDIQKSGGHVIGDESAIVTMVLDNLAGSYAHKNSIPLDQAIDHVREIYKDEMQNNLVLPQLVETEFGHQKQIYIRKKMDDVSRRQAIERDISDIGKVLHETESMTWLHELHDTSLVTEVSLTGHLAIFDHQIDKVQAKFDEAGYGVFAIDSWAYPKLTRVDLASLKIGEKNVIITRINKNGTPLDEDKPMLLSLSLFHRSEKGCHIGRSESFVIAPEYISTKIQAGKLPQAGTCLSMIGLLGDPERVDTLREIYTKAEPADQILFRKFITDKLAVYTDQWKDQLASLTGSREHRYELLFSKFAEHLPQDEAERLSSKYVDLNPTLPDYAERVRLLVSEILIPPFLRDSASPAMI